MINYGDITKLIKNWPKLFLGFMWMIMIVV